MNIVKTWHDDWFYYVVLEDGRVYLFQTELWPEHGDNTNWRVVGRRAKDEVKILVSRDAKSFCVVSSPASDFSQKFLQSEIDDAMERMSGLEFRCAIR